jgi:hypothetical protein
MTNSYDIKSETLSLRVSPVFALALKETVDSEPRSIVDFLEVLVAGCHAANGNTPPSQRSARTCRSANRLHAKSMA